jgi:uncharacterized protein YjbJ (UPF0337 family)
MRIAPKTNTIGRHDRSFSPTSTRAGSPAGRPKPNAFEPRCERSDAAHDNAGCAGEFRSVPLVVRTGTNWFTGVLTARFRHMGATHSDRSRSMNWDRVEGNWKQFKGQLQQKWGKLTDDDLDVIEGKRTELAGRLQERYGYAKDEAEKNIDSWLKNVN